MTCSSCPYYSALETQCRRNPPTAFPFPGAMGNIQVTAIFPPAQPSMWCGEHPERKASSDARPTLRLVGAN